MGAGGRQKVGVPHRYIGTVAVGALLTATLAAACLLVVERDGLTNALGQLANEPAALSPADVDLLARDGSIVAAAAIGAALLAVVAIRALRVSLYVGAVRRYAEGYLRAQAPLHTAGIDPEAVAFDGGGAPQVAGRAATLTRRLAGTSHLLVLGEAGSGKTVGLHVIAARMVRRRSFLGAATQRRQLPVLLSLAAYEVASRRAELSVADFTGRQLQRLGSEGLGLRAKRLLRRGRLLLLCDDLDAVPIERRADVCHDLADLAARYPRAPMVVACRLDAYRDTVYLERALGGFARVVLSGMREDQITATLRGGGRIRTLSGPRRSSQSRSLLASGLGASASLPAHLAAIRTLLRAGPAPAGRAEALVRYADHLLVDAGTALDNRGDVARALGALAAALRRREERFFSLSLGEDAASDLAELAADAPRAVERAAWREEGVTPNELALERAVDTGLRSGLLVRSADVGLVAFANGVVEASFAARWLAESDDGFGTLRPELLQSRWRLPLVLWAGVHESPGDLAKRLLRLIDTPDSAALRAGLGTPAELAPLTLALALAALTEGTTAALAAGTITAIGDQAGRAGSTEAMRLLANEHLRDVLDLAHIYLARPDGTAMLADALREVEGSVGPEFGASLATLAQAPWLSRLVRSEALVLLGILGGPASIETLATALQDMDPMIREAVNRAFVLSGQAGVEALRRIVADGGARERERAAEVMALLGDEAISAALELLSHGDETRRALAATTLGDLRASRAETLLVERLADGAPSVRVAAARALGKLGTARAGTALRQAATTGDGEARAAAVEALGAMRDGAAVSALMKLLDDNDAGLRGIAARALGQIGAEEAAPALEAHREDSDLWVRQAIGVALRRLGRAEGAAAVQASVKV